VDLYLEWRLSKSIQRQFTAFYNGFNITCEGRAIKMCRPEELEQLICGSPDIPLNELEEIATYVDFERNDKFMTFVCSVHR
jgi:ubiquitin-protein ligase E3 A